VLLSVWDCTGGEDCHSRALAELTAAGIPVLERSAVNRLTVGLALEQSRLRGGGHVLAVNGDASAPGFGTYDDMLECRGFKNRTVEEAWIAHVTACIGAPLARAGGLFNWTKVEACAHSAAGIAAAAEHYACWGEAPGAALAFERLFAFGRNLTALPPPRGGDLWSAQGAWAENEADVALGFLQGSSLMKDAKESGINRRWAAFVSNRTAVLHHPPLVGVNNVCEGGADLRQALLGRVLELAHRPDLLT
jgi:hypothetical protein